MKEFETNLCGYVALAEYVVNRGLITILGDLPIWSNASIEAENLDGKDNYFEETEEDEFRGVSFHVKRIHVPGTKHLYKMHAQVTVVKNPEGHWEFSEMDIHLHHPRMSDYIAHDRNIDISLEPGVETFTTFSSCESKRGYPEFEDVIFLPKYSSYFEVS